MATYLIGSEITIKRQAGDTADIVFTVPSILDMSQFTEVKFQVGNSSSVVISKALSEGELSVSGQVITIPLLAADTKNRAGGSNNWELEVSNETEIITIGRGTFEIMRELIL